MCVGNLRVILVVGFLLFIEGGTRADDPQDEADVSFSTDIAPILLEQCVTCHGARLAESGYRLDSYQALATVMTSGQQAIVVGDPDSSELFQRLIHDDLDLRMPLDADALTAEQVGLFRSWIEAGAVFDGGSKQQVLSSLLPMIVHPPAPEKYPAALPISAIAFDPTLQEIYVSGYHEITAWSPEGDLLRRFPNQGQRTYSIDINFEQHRLLASGGTPGKLGEVRIFDQKSGELITTLVRAEEVILDAKFSPDGAKIAVGLPSGAVEIFDSQTNQKQMTLLGHSDQITSLTWHADGDWLGTTSRDKAAKIFSLDAKRSLSTFGGHTDCVNSLAFLDRDEVVTVSDDGKAAVWSLRDGRRRREAVSGRPPLLEVVRLEGSYLVSGANEAHVFELGSNRKLKGITSVGDWLSVVAKRSATDLSVIGLHSGEVLIQGQDHPATRFLAKP